MPSVSHRRSTIASGPVSGPATRTPSKKCMNALLPLANMSQSSSHGYVGRSCSLKRHRQLSDDDDDDDEDIENYVPPNKRANLDSSSDSTFEDTCIPNSSPLLLSDDGSAIIDHSNGRTSSCTDSSSEESTVAMCSSKSVLTPLDNIQNKPKRRQSKPNVQPSVKKCPLPNFSWADSTGVWNRLYKCDAETANQRSASYLEFHPGLKPRMRAILIDWLNEVCDVYKLHRETFHLAINYLDRYLSNTENVHKNKLQLIGITCLFIAAKVEEVYPPKIHEFAYVTDGACTKEDILIEEVLILNTLDWDVSLVTINQWLNIYLQVHCEKNNSPIGSVYSNYKRDIAFLFTQYSSLDFIICSQLVDLAVLDINSNSFKNSQLAAAAIAHTHDKEIALQVSGYEWDELESCYNWLEPFMQTLNEGKEEAGDSLRTLPDCGSKSTSSGAFSSVCPNANLDQSHRIQVHSINMDYYDKAESYIANKENIEGDQSYCAEINNSAISTPPNSGHKKSSSYDEHSDGPLSQ